MFLKHTPTGDLVEILDMADLTNPRSSEVRGRFHSGEELQEATSFSKRELAFPSGEALPRCWVAPHYKAH